MSGKSDKAKADWKTATQYHLCHALAIATLPAYQRTPARAAAGLLFSTGITLFSGSVYYACECVASKCARALRHCEAARLNRRPPLPPCLCAACFRASVLLLHEHGALIEVENATDLPLALTLCPTRVLLCIICCCAGQH